MSVFFIMGKTIDGKKLGAMDPRGALVFSFSQNRRGNQAFGFFI